MFLLNGMNRPDSPKEPLSRAGLKQLLIKPLPEWFAVDMGALVLRQAHAIKWLSESLTEAPYILFDIWLKHLRQLILAKSVPEDHAA